MRLPMDGFAPAISARWTRTVSSTITGRKKDIIITSGGKNIAPANLEMDLVALPLVEHAIVCGEPPPILDRGHHTECGRSGSARGAMGTAGKRSPAQGSDPSGPAIRHRCDQCPPCPRREYPAVHDPAAAAVDRTGDLTPTMKVKRATVLKRILARYRRDTISKAPRSEGWLPEAVRVHFDADKLLSHSEVGPISLETYAFVDRKLSAVWFLMPNIQAPIMP